MKFIRTASKDAHNTHTWRGGLVYVYRVYTTPLLIQSGLLLGLLG